MRQTSWLLFAAFSLISLLTACPSSEESEPSTFDSEALKPSCVLIRQVELADAEGIFLINICPPDDSESNDVIDISEEGQDPIMAYFDTIMSFSSKKEAVAFAKENNIYDAKYK